MESTFLKEPTHPKRITGKMMCKGTEKKGEQMEEKPEQRRKETGHKEEYTEEVWKRPKHKKGNRRGRGGRQGRGERKGKIRKERDGDSKERKDNRRNL